MSFINPDVIKDYAIATGVEGLSMYAVDRVWVEALKNKGFVDSVVKNLKMWAKPVLYFGVSLVVFVLAGDKLVQGRLALAGRAVRAIGSLGIKYAIHYGVREIPFLVPLDTQTIEVYNLDPNETVKVIIDGSEVSFSTAPTTDGNGYAKITLPSALEEGTHKILAHTGFKAVYAEIYVSGTPSGSTGGGTSS